MASKALRVWRVLSKCYSSYHTGKSVRLPRPSSTFVLCCFLICESAGSAYKAEMALVEYSVQSVMEAGVQGALG